MKGIVKTVGLICCCVGAVAAHAKDKSRDLLDKVSLSVTAERWVTTNTANLQVTINATLTKKSLAEMRNDILKNLNTIAKADWHITQFNRSQDSSGLEKLFVSAEARVNQSVLTGVNQQAKAVSVPGATYRISNIDFSPSDSDVQKVKTQVRQDLYKKVQQEVDTLNAQYKPQHYSVFRVMVATPSVLNMKRQQYNRSARKNVMFAMAQESSANISVSNKVKLTAIVTLASNRDDD